jgi:hypothetical protein
MKKTFFILLVCLLVWFTLTAAPKPSLELKVWPQQGFSPLTVKLRAEIKGELTEEWACPEVVWRVNEMLYSKELSDCDENVEPQTVWWKEITIETTERMEVPFSVELYHNDRLLAEKKVTVLVVDTLG